MTRSINQSARPGANPGQDTDAANAPLIVAEHVVRDSRGFWRHTQMPDPFPDYQAFELWYSHHQLESRIVLMTEDGEARDSAGAPTLIIAEHCAAWKPSAPQGEGWFLLCIGMSDSEGPAAWWVRRRSATSVEAHDPRHSEDL